ncbi:MAG: J domain-containing protein [Dehalococcoidales bacterium]|nr:J domain-containing protein [Dehalococcoidales bacterium]
MNNTNNKDYYEILGKTNKATQQEIKEAYRKLAFKYHPDRNKDDPAASDKMKAINEAYATLSNPNKRRDYDMLRDRYGSMAYERYRQTHTQEDIFRGSDIEQILQEFARQFGFRNANEIFRDFYGPGFQGSGQPGYSFRTYVYNASRNRQTGNQQTIPPGQSGFASRMIQFILEKFLRIQIPQRGKDIFDTLKITPETAKQGGEVKYHYDYSGKVKDLIVKIPVDIKDGKRIRLKEMGAPGKAGGPPGDMYLIIQIKKPFWQRLKTTLFNK